MAATHKKRLYISITKVDDLPDDSVRVKKCTITAKNDTGCGTISYSTDNGSTWKDGDTCVISGSGQHVVIFRCQPSNDEEKKEYSEYQITATVTYFEEYELGDFIEIVSSTDDYVPTSQRLAYSGSDVWFEKCEYIGHEEGQSHGLYANPSKYKAILVSRYDMVQKGSLPETTNNTRTSIVNFYYNDKKIQEVMIRAMVEDGTDDSTTSHFPSDGDSGKLMSIRKSSNLEFDPNDTKLSNIIRDYDKNAGIDVDGWCYYINDMQYTIDNVLDFSFTWQAALTDVHKNDKIPNCMAQTRHYAIYSLYPVSTPKEHSVKFYDGYGVELSAYSRDNVQHMQTVVEPPTQKCIRSRNDMYFHSGWIDSTDGSQADTFEVTKDMKCIPYYSCPLKDTDGIIDTSDLKKYVVDVIAQKCDNVGEFYVKHEFYKPGYARVYGNIQRTIANESCKYLTEVTIETLQRNVEDYMNGVDMILEQYKGKKIGLNLIFLYYLAMTYFVKKTVTYVHGYKHELLGGYSASHIMYVPDINPDFSEYIRNFDLIEDTVALLMDNGDQMDIKYEYKRI